MESFTFALAGTLAILAVAAVVASLLASIVVHWLMYRVPPHGPDDGHRHLWIPGPGFFGGSCWRCGISEWEHFIRENRIRSFHHQED